MSGGQTVRNHADGLTSLAVGVVPGGDFKRSIGFQGLTELIARKGGDPAAILNLFGIDRQLLEDEDAYLPYSRMIRLIDFCAETLDAPFFGFELAISQTAEVTGQLAILLLAAPTVEEGLALVTRYMAIHSPGGRLAYSVADDEARVTYEVLEPSVASSRQINEMNMTCAYNSLRTIVGDDFCVNSVDIAGTPPPVPADTPEAYFGAPFYYNQAISSLRFPAHFLQYRVDTGNELLLRYARAQCDKLMRQEDQLSSVVAEAVRHLLPMGECTISTVARQLALHPRSLQNRLATEGREFREIVRTQRMTLARAYLTESRTPLTEVAMLLGYSDQAAFTRAFSAWQGVSPKRYRVATSQRSRF